MLLEEIKNIKSDKRDLRNFGLTIGVATAILGGLLLWKEKDTYVLFLLISVLLMFLGLLSPAVLKPVQKVWMIFAVILGWFMTRLILSVLFYIVFTSIGFVHRIVGKKFLDTEMNDGKVSYWMVRKQKDFDKRDYEKQF